MNKKKLLPFVLALSLIGASGEASAHGSTLDEVLGGGLGAAAGAVVGQVVGGRTGAIIGSGIGGAGGAILVSRHDNDRGRNDRYDDRDRRPVNYHHDDYRRGHYARGPDHNRGAGWRR